MTTLPATLEDSLRAFAQAAEAPNTRRAYRADFALFAEWCATHQCAPLPASPLAVCAFLTDQAKAEVSPATISRRIAAIAFVHRATGNESPVTEHVRRIMRGIRRTYGSEARGKAPLTADLIKRLIDEAKPGLRDRALLLLGFAGAFRRSELAALTRHDIELSPEGILIHIRRSKTDIEGRGQTIAIVRAGDERYCPVRALEAWLAAMPAGKDRIFPLTGYSIACIVKRAARRAGLDAEAFGAHSLRSGFVTSAALNGAALFRVMEHTRHKSVQSAKRYFHAEKFRDHPAKGIL